jgi:hypothetical protein
MSVRQSFYLPVLLPAGAAASTSTVSGNQPAASGALSRVVQEFRAPTGNRPRATGTATRILHDLRTASGNQPAPSGAMVRKFQGVRPIYGVHPKIGFGTFGLIDGPTVSRYGIVSHWRLQADSDDWQSGYSLIDQASTTFVAGPREGRAHLNSGDYFVADDFDGGLSTDGISFWLAASVTPGTVSAGNNSTIISRYAGFGSGEFVLSLEDVSGSIKLRLKLSGLTSSLFPQDPVFTHSKTLDANTDYAVMAYFDTDHREVGLSVNGEPFERFDTGGIVVVDNAAEEQVGALNDVATTDFYLDNIIYGLSPTLGMFNLANEISDWYWNRAARNVASATLTRFEQEYRTLTGRRPTPGAYDTFTRADSAVTMGTAESGQVWTPSTGTWGIDTGQAYSPDASGDRYTVIEVEGPDGTFDVDLVNASDGSQDSGLVFRWIDSGNFLLFHNYFLFIVDSGSFSILQANLYPVGPGAHHLKAVLRGTSIKLYVDGALSNDYTLVGSEATKFTTPTKIGLRDNSAGLFKAHFDNLTFDQAGILTRELQAVRSLAGNEPSATGTLTRLLSDLRSVAGDQLAPTGLLTRLLQELRSVSGDHPAPSGSLSYTYSLIVNLLGDQPYPTGSLAYSLLAAQSLTGNQPYPTGTLTRILHNLISLSGDQPYPTGSLTLLASLVRDLSGSQPAPSGALALLSQLLRSVSGDQPTPTGTLTRVLQEIRSLSGNQPYPTGTLTDLLVVLRALSGNQPAPSGTLLNLLIQVRDLSGSQPAPSGSIIRRLDARRSLLGNQPTAVGLVLRVLTTARLLAGVQPPPTGTLLISTSHDQFLVGNQPAASGELTNLLILQRLLSGSQPAPSGALDQLAAYIRFLVGNQPAAQGQVTRSLALLLALLGEQPAPSGTLTVIESNVLQVLLGLRSPTQATPGLGTILEGSIGSIVIGTVGSSTIGETGTDVLGKPGTETEEY